MVGVWGLGAASHVISLSLENILDISGIHVCIYIYTSIKEGVNIKGSSESQDQH